MIHDSVSLNNARPFKIAVVFIRCL